MRILVNGERKELKDRGTVLDLLVTMGLGTTPVAVERNHDIIPRAVHATTELADGDEVEVVHFVGGG
ncbi:MAG: sulfur carrier protein ThiS [Sandaracinaceae bacterium]|nr:sulfur carrier protein ThiS [Sandaracinaceae bacterium]